MIIPIPPLLLLALMALLPIVSACSSTRSSPNLAHSVAVAGLPANAFDHVARGRMLKEQGDESGALADFTEAIRLNPSNVTAYEERGLLLLLHGKPVEARKDFSAAIAMNPASVIAHFNRGVAETMLKNARGMVNANAGNHAEAIADFTICHFLQPGRAEVPYQRGLARLKIGRADQALEDFSLATRLKPVMYQAYFSQGEALERLGKRQEALQAYKTYLDSDVTPTDGRRHAEARDRVEKLQKGLQ